MNKIKTVLLGIGISAVSALNAQIEGDSLFATDQVMTIELNFAQTGYWDSLTANYLTETYMAADMTITTLNGSRSFPNVAVRLKGNSTYNHPNNKKPFKIDFNKYVSGQNFDGIKKLNLSNGFKDPSCMREKVFFDFCREAGVNAPRANFANLYINGNLLGFYTVVEQIDDQFLDWAILDDDGNLFKAGDNFGTGSSPADLKYYGTTATDYGDRYELKTNETANDWSDLVELLNFINNSSDADFGSAFSSYFEQQELLRSIAIDNLFGNLDSYTGSARNYYLYHNLTTNKWEWIKWDANEAFGSYSNGQNTSTLDVEYHNSDRPLLDRIFADPVFNTAYKNEICDLIDTYFNNAYLDAKIDAIYNLIQADVYADNNKMFTNANFDSNISSNITSGGGPGGGTIYGLKSFVTTRVNNITQQIDCNYYNAVDELNEVSFDLYPNPANDKVTIALEIGVDGVELRDVMGKLVYMLDLPNPQQSIDISLTDMSEGVYFVGIFLDGGLLAKQKLVITK